MREGAGQQRGCHRKQVLRKCSPDGTGGNRVGLEGQGAVMGSGKTRGVKKMETDGPQEWALHYSSPEGKTSGVKWTSLPRVPSERGTCGGEALACFQNLGPLAKKCI
jgi:hypothetical protein